MVRTHFAQRPQLMVPAVSSSCQQHCTTASAASHSATRAVFWNRDIQIPSCRTSTAPLEKFGSRSGWAPQGWSNPSPEAIRTRLTRRLNACPIDARLAPIPRVLQASLSLAIDRMFEYTGIRVIRASCARRAMRATRRWKSRARSGTGSSPR
jgi:hypothetical protein